jgi:hypothetical protein
MPGSPLWSDLFAPTLLLGLVAAGLGAILAYYYRLQPARLVLRRPAVPRGPLTYGAASERRVGFRRRGGRVKVQLADADGKTELGNGWVIDRSTGGLGLTVDHPLEAGELLSVRPAHAPGRTPWVQVEVKSCRQRSGVWEVGCQFVRRPSLNVLLHFG